MIYRCIMGNGDGSVWKPAASGDEKTDNGRKITGILI